jgi:hypothetical protein
VRRTEPSADVDALRKERMHVTEMASALHRFGIAVTT